MGTRFNNLPFFRFSDTRKLLVNAGFLARSAFTKSQDQQWLTRALTRSHSRTYCSSSNSPSSFFSNNGFIGWYLHKLETRPIITKAITTSLIFAAADLSSQMITLPPSSSFDSLRTLRMAVYGLSILGPTQHFWFNFVSKALPKKDTLTTLKKLFIGQALFGPYINTVFFTYNAVLQGEKPHEIVARLKRDLPSTMMSNILYWPVCDFVTFKFVPVHLQPLLNSSCAYVWTIYLTYKASLQKVNTD